MVNNIANDMPPVVVMALAVIFLPAKRATIANKKKNTAAAAAIRENAFPEMRERKPKPQEVETLIQLGILASGI